MASYGRITISGLSQGTENWATSFALGTTGSIGSWDQTLGDAQAAAALAVTIPSTLLSILSSAFSYTQLRWEQRDVTTNALQGVSVAVKGSPVLGTGTPSKTPQDSVVLSLRTATPGARGRGRMYWPAIAVTLSSTTFAINSVSTASIAGDAKTYLTGIASAILGTSGTSLPDLFPVVYSGADHATHRVNRIQVGGILDTQRRRRHGLAESYATVTLP